VQIIFASRRKKQMASHFEERLKGVELPPVIKRYFSDGQSPDSMSSEQLAGFQLEAVQELAKRAYDKSSFYHNKMVEKKVLPEDIKGLADLPKLPFLTKEDLRQDPWATLACSKSEISFIHASSGTTGGKAIYSMFSWPDYYLQHVIIYPKLIPVEPGDICFIALPYEMSSAGLAFHYKFMIGYRATVVPAGKGGAYSTPEKAIRLIRKLQPTIIVTSPSYAMILAEEAAQESFDLKSLPLKKIWLTGEGCSKAFRQRVEKIWRTTANFSYGSMECSGIANECDAHDGYHISEAHALVEIIDPETSEPLPPGEVGEVVVTSLLRYDTPIIRYRTQDLGSIDSKPCSCGLHLKKLRLWGRKVDQIIVQDKSFSPFYLENILMEFPEVGNWYQFVISDNGEHLIVKVEPAENTRPNSELTRVLSQKLTESSGVPCLIEFVDHIPRTMTKAIRVIRQDKKE
jgi:phenylacetate-CoA ligase